MCGFNSIYRGQWPPSTDCINKLVTDISILNALYKTPKIVEHEYLHGQVKQDSFLVADPLQSLPPF